MATALEVLRSYHDRPDEVIIEDDKISFGTQSFSTDTEVIKIKDDSFSILQIWLLLLYSKKAAEYMRQCTAAKVKPIPRNERKSVINLFTGVSVSLKKNKKTNTI